MKRSLTLVLLVGLVSACGTDEPVSREPPPLPMPAPAGSSPVSEAPSTTLYDIIPEDEDIRDYLTEWTITVAEEDITAWEKHVEEVSVWYDATPDIQQACEQLLTSPTFLRGLPGTPEAHQTVLDVLVTQGVKLPYSEWILEGSEHYEGVGGPALDCMVANDGSEQWGTHLPGIEAVMFGEADLLGETWSTGLRVEEGWKHIYWFIGS